jgi:general secretion pathway protein I
VTPPAHALERGFSLLELLVAFSIMAGSLVVLYKATGGVIDTTGRLDRHARALQLAESVLAGRDCIEPANPAARGEWFAYRWTLASAPYPARESADGSVVLHRVELSVSWPGEGVDQSLGLITILPQCIEKAPTKG